MTAIILTERQKKLYDELFSIITDLKARILSRSYSYSEEDSQLFDKMAELAHDLHNDLKGCGTEPKHHKYMLTNRRVPVTDIEFYRHIHPVEDLLDYIKDTNANDDPEDMTIDHEFTFTVFSRRWGHTDTYSINRISTGWVIESTPCNQSFEPGLFDILNHDSINFPEELPRYYNYLWERASEDGLSHAEVQEAVTQLANWVTLCEQNSPVGIFKGYK